MFCREWGALPARASWSAPDRRPFSLKYRIHNPPTHLMSFCVEETARHIALADAPETLIIYKLLLCFFCSASTRPVILSMTAMTICKPADYCRAHMACGSFRTRLAAYANSYCIQSFARNAYDRVPNHSSCLGGTNAQSEQRCEPNTPVTTSC